ncbi:uncharacterized protein LOC134657197 [Cydia amplana]|uniref:uncharacterized protein LOC134657197 n=1 Tax=Cydia amplana TaxID=1869771 RepID=UPI002FE57363
MVNTRSTTRREQERKEEELKQASIQQPQTPVKDEEPKKPIDKTIILETGSQIKSEHSVQRNNAKPPSHRSHKTSYQGSKKSASSSIVAQKKKLELEAAEAKARIQMDLIDKKLQVDLANLDEYSPSEKSEPSEQDHQSVKSDVARWVERSQLELESQHVLEPGNNPGALCSSAAVVAGTELPVQELASALRELATVSASNNNQNARLLSRISTPKELPLFYGEPMEWLQFKQAFEESTRVCSFSDIENMWRLRKCLRGPAKESVNALLISGTSTETLMSTLELQFGNPELIISRMLIEIKKLHALPPEYHKEIVTFSVKIKNYVTAVRALGRGEYLQEMSIVGTILSKLPTLLLPKWNDYSYALIKEGTKSKLDILSEFLHEEAMKVSTCSASLMQVRSDYKRKNYSENSDYKPQTILVQSAQTNSTDKCRFCRVGTHNLPECKKFKKSLRKDRWQYVKRFGLCYKCLLSHHDRQSCTAAACDVEGCGQAHHRLLNYVSGQSSRSTPYNVVEVSDTSAQTETVTHINANQCEVLLKVVPIYLHGPNGKIKTTGMLDDGSSVSFISTQLAERAGLRGHRQILNVRGAWVNSELKCETQLIDCSISNSDGTMFNLTARSANDLDLAVQNVGLVKCGNYKYLDRIKNYLCAENQKPEILIGQDNYHLHVPLEIVEGGKNEPYATRSPLGWCVHGPCQRATVMKQREIHTSLHLSHNYEQDIATENNQILRELQEDIRRSFSIDSMGVSAKPRQNSEDVLAQEHLEQTSELIDGQWQVGLPWKDPHCVTVDSYPNALSRLKGVELKMKRSEEYARRYKERIRHLLDNKYAEKLKNPVTSTRTWYLPTHGVDNPNKKSLRLVFDGSAKTKGLSLNSYLYKGPDLLVPLIGIMWRFRENKVAISGDIKDMFLRVKIKPDDQQALRFLYRDNPEDPIHTYQMTSLIFGANCAPFIAQFIKNKNVRRFESTYPEAANAIYTQHYVDDYIDSLPDEKSAMKLVRDVTYIHARGDFHIRNWNSNSQTVINSIPKETLGNSAVMFKVGQQYEGERTLGLLWNPNEDTLGFDVSLKKLSENIIHGKERPTKRDILRVVMSIFDVYGFLAPFTINGRLIVQLTWHLGVTWDEQVPDVVYEKWLKWINQLKLMREIRLPRYYQHAATSANEIVTESPSASEMVTAPTSVSETATEAASASGTRLVPVISAAGGDAPAQQQDLLTMNSYKDLQLHLFCDSLMKVMCAVAYWRWKENNTIRTAFITSKCRVAGLKKSTVPRLELNSAVMAARLAETIIKEHRIKPDRRIFWCDATVVLYWVRNNARTYKPYIANRLGEIDDLTHASEWRYVPTHLNVADIPTRESYDRCVLPTEWIQGPAFLQKSENDWPENILNADVNNDELECVMTMTSCNKENIPIPEPTRFSSWLRLLRATFIMLKFINKCKHINEEDGAVMEKAERLLIKYSQAQTFSDEILKLKNGLYLPKTSRLLTLSPYLDEHEVLRLGGRIDAAAEVGPETKRPSILDGRDYIARLLVKHHHVLAAHGNQETVVNNLKQKHWILRLRPTVKNVTKKCMLCRIRKCKQEIPRMGDLPPARVAHHQRAFTYTGADLFGPLEVTVGRGRQKRYGVLFTCLTVRAVHIEIVNSLTSDSFIMALRRMGARRGWPQYLYSDNGTNLRGADAELRKSIQELDQEYLKRESLNYGTKWIFIPPGSPHWGGAWERQIRTVKECMKVVLKERAPREETLCTFLAEVESIVNSRPLTHVSVEPGSTETLTPNHFLLGSSSVLPHLGAYNDSEYFLKKQWRIAQRLADLYWRRWVKEILPDLLPRKKWTQEVRPLQVGDLVLIVDPDGPRCAWPKGLVEQLLPGKDGRVRAVRIKTKSGVLTRSAARVARIPIDGECC